MESTGGPSNSKPHSPPITPPIWLNGEGPTERVLTCNICCEIPFDPVVTPCDHIFCRTCIHLSLRRRSCCPNDRASLRSSQLRNLDGPLQRIWSDTPVKCPECQIWTGTLQCYQADHGKRCINPQKRIKELEELLHLSRTALHETKTRLEGKILDLENKLKEVTRTTSQASYAQVIPLSNEYNKREKRTVLPKPMQSAAASPFVSTLPSNPVSVTHQHNSTSPFGPSIPSDQRTGPFSQSNNITVIPPNPSQSANTGSSTTTNAPNEASPGTFSITGVQFQLGTFPPREQRRIIRARRP
jgi:hypothetical protein